MNHSEKEKLIESKLDPALLGKFTPYNDDNDDDIHCIIHHQSFRKRKTG